MKLSRFCPSCEAWQPHEVCQIKSRGTLGGTWIKACLTCGSVDVDNNADKTAEEF